MAEVKRGIVVHFDDNLGRAIIRLLDTGERLKITYRDIDMDGFVVLFEGQYVVVKIEGEKVKVIPIENE
jgi:cold shock CspA family protein